MIPQTVRCLIPDYRATKTECKNKDPEKIRKNKKVVKKPRCEKHLDETCLNELLAQGTKSDGQTLCDNDPFENTL